MPSDLTREEVTVRTYVNRLVAHMSNIYSLCSLFLAFLGTVSYWFGHNLFWLSAGAVVFSILPASYRTWLEALSQAPQTAALAVTCLTGVVDAPIETRAPNRTGKLDIRLDVSNPNDEIVYLMGVELLSWNAEGVFAKPASAKLYGQRERAGFGELRYPVKLDPHDRRDDIAFFASLDLAMTDASEFANKLFRANAISYSFRIISENSARARHNTEIEDTLSLDVYKGLARTIWNRNGHKDLLDAAGL